MKLKYVLVNLADQVGCLELSRTRPTSGGYYSRVTLVDSERRWKEKHVLAIELAGVRVKRVVEDGDAISMTLGELTTQAADCARAAIDGVVDAVARDHRELLSKKASNSANLRFHLDDPMRFEDAIGKYQMRLHAVRSASTERYAAGAPHDVRLLLQGVSFSRERFSLDWKLLSLRPSRARESTRRRVPPAIEEDRSEVLPDVDDWVTIHKDTRIRLDDFLVTLRTVVTHADKGLPEPDESASLDAAMDAAIAVVRGLDNVVGTVSSKLPTKLS